MSLHYIIDGYNVIKQTPSLTKKSLKDSRLSLVKLIKEKRPQGSKNNEVTIVFDGKADLPYWPKEKEIDINIVFTKNNTADDWIKNAVERTDGPRRIVVVSDDKQIRFYVRSLGAKVLGVKEFIKAAERSKGAKNAEPSDSKIELSSVEAERITEELRKIWLK